MNKKQLAMGLFALGTSALPVTDKIIKEAGNQEGASITSKAYVITGIYSGNYHLQAGGTLIGTAGRYRPCFRIVMWYSGRCYPGHWGLI